MNNHFSSILTQLRHEKGISQKAAAKELGISQALLSHYENGIRECGLDFVVRAAEFYQVSCDYLLGLSNSSCKKSKQLPKSKELSSNIILSATSDLLVQTEHLDDSQRLALKELFILALYDIFLIGSSNESIDSLHLLLCNIIFSKTEKQLQRNINSKYHYTNKNSALKILTDWASSDLKKSQ